MRYTPDSRMSWALHYGTTLFLTLCSMAWLCGALVPSASAATLPAGFSETLVASGLSSPMSMTFAPDGRLFVCEQGGKVRVIKNGALLSTPFVSLSVKSGGSMGLLNLTFDPNFNTNHFVYVQYTTATAPNHNRVSRLTANGDVAVAGSEVVIFDIDLDALVDHFGGPLAFRADGKLYIATGDNYVPIHGQEMNSLLGKILRLNADGTIPTDNPFYNTATGKHRAIWALGLRNPFTLAIQPGTDRFFINDVGEDVWEEINEGVAGANYGWATTEGPTNNPAFRSPVYAYNHSDGCAITGGAFYNPRTQQFPSAYAGKYFFTDLCNGWVRVLDPATNTATAFSSGLYGPIDLKVDADGSLYYLAYGTNSVYKFTYSTVPTGPTISSQPADVSVPIGGTAKFSVGAYGSGILRYQWQRNTVNINGATASSYSITGVTANDNGARFRCIVSDDAGSATSREALLTVTSNQMPTANITAPAVGTLYSGGQVINYAGTGNDPETGALPPSAFTWRVDFHHGTHTHPFVADRVGATSGSFTIPILGETATDVFYRIYLTVRDSAGATNTAYRDIKPRIVTLSLGANPSGAQITLDGQPRATPSSEQSVVGMQRTLGVASPQTISGASYNFSFWSDNGAATHTISTPTTNTAYTANFSQGGGATVGTGTGLKGVYFNNQDFTGTSTTRTDPQIAFIWGANAPISGIAADTFSTRWTGQVQAQYSQTYTFYLRGDDGVRLWVNGQQLINSWKNQSATEYSGAIALTAGQKYDVKIEYYDGAGDATCELRWSSASTPKQLVPKTQLFPDAGTSPPGTPPPSPPPGSGNGLKGVYFNNQDFTGTSVTRVDPQVAFNWGANAPISGIAADTFSTRWTGQVQAQYSQTYTFYLRGDDGVRLWVNNVLLVNSWKGQSATEYSGTIALTAGQKYDVKIEYYDGIGDAVCEFRWSSASTPKAFVPKVQLFAAP
jgi:glucose/arabinose dehydrogenase